MVHYKELQKNPYRDSDKHQTTVAQRIVGFVENPENHFPKIISVRIRNYLARKPYSKVETACIESLKETDPNNLRYIALSAVGKIKRIGV